MIQQTTLQIQPIIFRFNKELHRFNKALNYFPTTLHNSSASFSESPKHSSNPPNNSSDSTDYSNDPPHNSTDSPEGTIWAYIRNYHGIIVNHKRIYRLMEMLCKKPHKNKATRKNMRPKPRADPPGGNNRCTHLLY